MRNAALIAVTVVAFFALRSDRLSRDPEDYGRFADDVHGTSRNVLSNLALLVVGTAGVVWVLRHRGDDAAAALALFGGVIATAIGSASFHLEPEVGRALNRPKLFWDRLPMTVAFAGLLALVMRDRVFHRPNRLPLPLLAAAGMATTVYWYVTHDLYPYAFFQLFAAAGTLLMICALRPSTTEAGYVAGAVFLFGVAKLLEDFDDAIYARYGFGGHPLKHVAGAAAALLVLLWLIKRRPTLPAPPRPRR